MPVHSAHIVAVKNIYCRRQKYMPISILFSRFQTNVATIYTLTFDTSCRRQQNMPMLSHSAYFDNGHKKFFLTKLNDYLQIVKLKINRYGKLTF